MTDEEKDLLGMISDALMPAALGEMGYESIKTTIPFEETEEYKDLVQQKENSLISSGMSQSFIDVHQEGLQNWQIMKNNVALGDNTILLQGRRHPSIEGVGFECKNYENAYDTGISMKELLAHAIKYIAEEKDFIFVMRKQSKNAEGNYNDFFVHINWLGDIKDIRKL